MRTCNAITLFLWLSVARNLRFIATSEGWITTLEDYRANYPNALPPVIELKPGLWLSNRKFVNPTLSSAGVQSKLTASGNLEWLDESLNKSKWLPTTNPKPPPLMECAGDGFPAQWSSFRC